MSALDDLTADAQADVSPWLQAMAMPDARSPISANARRLCDVDLPTPAELEAVEAWSVAYDLLALHLIEAHPEADAQMCSTCRPLVKAEKLAFERMERVNGGQR